MAHKIGFAVNTLCLLPFASIWHVAIYDIDRMQNANQLFARMFDWFVSGMGILLLGASLTVHPILPLLTPDAYGNAIDLISVILLGFFVFGLQSQFEVPAMLEKRTGLLVPGSIAGVVVNVIGNMLLIPVIGLWGAAWTGVLTYAAFSFTTFSLCRKIRPIPYRWRRNVLAVAGLATTYIVLRYALFPQISRLGELAVSILCCTAWSAVLFGRDGLEWWKSGGRIQSLRDIRSKGIKVEHATPTHVADSTEMVVVSKEVVCSS